MVAALPPPHVSWLKRSAEPLVTAEGASVAVIDLEHAEDDVVLSQWARHFRSHYCSDAEIDELRFGTGLSRAEYLIGIKFPTEHDAPGPSIRSGDFSEILVADYLEYVQGYFVPRTRYDRRTIRNESTKGSDVIGFLMTGGSPSPADILAIFEAKGQLTGRTYAGKLQQAITDSGKDAMRSAESLNAMRQRLRDRGDAASAAKVARFQDRVGHPYEQRFGAAAILCGTVFAPDDIKASTGASGLELLVIRGTELMKLAHALYARAAREA